LENQKIKIQIMEAIDIDILYKPESIHKNKNKNE